VVEPLRHNHARKLQRLAAEGKLAARPGVVRHVEVRHDDWCALLVLVQGGFCDCEPHIVLRQG
jgi:hypothetical protein